MSPSSSSDAHALCSPAGLGPLAVAPRRSGRPPNMVHDGAADGAAVGASPDVADPAVVADEDSVVVDVIGAEAGPLVAAPDTGPELPEELLHAAKNSPAKSATN